MGATSGTTVVEVYLAYRNLKDRDLKMIIYLFEKLLKYMGVPAWKHMEQTDVFQLKAVPALAFIIF